MPTHEEDSAFLREVARLTPQQREQFRLARAQFIEDLRGMEAGTTTWFRGGLVHKLRGVRGRYELRWAEDGRAVFSFGNALQSGVTHIRWHHCGTHDILP